MRLGAGSLALLQLARVIRKCLRKTWGRILGAKSATMVSPAPAGDTDLRLCKFFGLSEGYFLLQNAYDTLESKRHIAEQVTKIKPYKPGKAA